MSMQNIIELKTKYKKAIFLIDKSQKIRSRQSFALNVEKSIKILSKNIGNKKKEKLIKECSFTLLLTNNKEIKKLNKDFRDVNKATDVLSFPSGSESVKQDKYLGDIAISYEYVLKLSKEKNHRVINLLTLLTIHGYLHLLGYDHDSKNKAMHMFNIQKDTLKRLKIDFDHDKYINSF